MKKLHFIWTPEKRNWWGIYNDRESAIIKYFAAKKKNKKEKKKK